MSEENIQNNEITEEMLNEANTPEEIKALLGEKPEESKEVEHTEEEPSEEIAEESEDVSQEEEVAEKQDNDDDLAARLKKLETHNKNLEKWNNQRNTLVGEQAKLIKELQEALNNKNSFDYDDEFSLDDDPKKVVKETLKTLKTEEKAEELSRMERIESNKAELVKLNENFDEKYIEKAILHDGADENSAKQFINNMWSSDNAKVMAFNLFSRGVMLEEMEKKDAEIERLKKEISDKPNKIREKLSKTNTLVRKNSGLTLPKGEQAIDEDYVNQINDIKSIREALKNSYKRN